MQKRSRKRAKRLRKLIVMCFLCALILVVSTYAWFVGMRSVKVSPFDVEIAAADSLLLSLNGEKWSNEIYISKDTLNTVSYTGHKNSWGGTGLIPMSTIGEMDSDASRMKIYEKASFTPTKGGYRLMASRVNNYGTGEDEKSGYVVFDLFVKNFSGTQYLPELNPADEEAIYLTTDSQVTVAADGVADTGIENSVRVAFTQIGRVNGTENLATITPAIITGITCSNTHSGDEDTLANRMVTGICRDAQIWEPNDTKHVDDALRWYNESCIKRIGATIEDTSYATDPAIVPCKTLTDGTSYATYAVRKEIAADEQVDIYDGAAYNYYEGSATQLYAYPYFTDTMRDLTGTDRPLFMTLEPNSITKLRVYIYIEGQDVDNYDFAAIGKKITVTFGFTKERFTPEDISYNGPYLPSDIGACFGGEMPATADACDAAYGEWNAVNSECSARTEQYCSAIGGRFTPYGTCTGSTGTTPTTKDDCEEAYGEWDEAGGTCSSTNTAGWCTAMEGTFTATGLCYQPTVVIETEQACTTAKGTWSADTSTCTGNNRTFCAAAKGTFKPGLDQ